jgi:hypothetical protein
LKASKHVGELVIVRGAVDQVSVGFNKYHLTTLGRAVASLALQLWTFLVTPSSLS